MIRFMPLLLVAGCADFAMSEGAYDEPDADNQDTAMESNPDYSGAQIGIRLDVYAESATDSGLLNQTFYVDRGDSRDLDLFIQPSIAVSGSLSGFQTYPTADVQVPGALSAVPGTLRAFVPNSLMSYSVELTEEETFSFDAVAAENYTLAWIPDASVNLPFEVEEGVPLLDDTVFNKTLSYDESVTLYGAVKREGGLGLPGVSVQIHDRFTGIGNAAKTTNNMGAFNFRLYPGEYTVDLSGQSDAGVPSYTSTLLLSDARKGDVELNFDLGDLNTVNADGLVEGPNGALQGGVLVRLTALSLDGHTDAGYTTQSTTGSNGRFSIPVLPGLYQVEYIPPHDGNLSPLLIDEPIRLDQSVTELNAVELNARPIVTSRLVDIYGEGMENSLIRVQEAGFDGAVFETYTNDLGLFELAVSDGPLTWTLIPADTNRGAITYLNESAKSINAQEISLNEGQLVSGCIAHGNGTVDFVPVEVRTTTGTLFASTFTDDEGCFSVRVDVESNQ